jgi:hypothetical protein
MLKTISARNEHGFNFIVLKICTPRVTISLNRMYKYDLSCTHSILQRRYFKTFEEPRNQFQGIDSASLSSLAGRYDNSIIKTDFYQVRHTLQRNLDLCIPRQGIARPQSQFPRTCVSVSDQYIPAFGPPIFLQQNRQTDQRNI